MYKSSKSVEEERLVSVHSPTAATKRRRLWRLDRIDFWFSLFLNVFIIICMIIMYSAFKDNIQVSLGTRGTDPTSHLAVVKSEKRTLKKKQMNEI